MDTRAEEADRTLSPDEIEERRVRPPISLAQSAADAGLRNQVEQYILASISSISAFPLSRLQLGQRLVGELGFDSLMLV
ncbi:hypothetical protein ABTO93_20215, partial [Acinetobacter baumannii]